MGEIEWAMWANEQAVVSAFLLLVGGIIGVAASFRFWECAACSIVVAVIVLLIEWPRSKRKKGNTIERRFQSFIVPVVDKLGPVGRNYYFRFVGQILMSIPTLLLLPTILGGICLIISAFIYLAAAIKGEQWTPLKPRSPASPHKEVGRSEPPSHPPPRNPVRKTNAAAEPPNRY